MGQVIARLVHGESRHCLPLEGLFGWSPPLWVGLLVAGDFNLIVKEEHSSAITEHCEQIKHQSSVIHVLISCVASHYCHLLFAYTEWLEAWRYYSNLYWWNQGYRRRTYFICIFFFDFHYQLTELICEYMFTSEIDSLLKPWFCCKDWLYKYPTNESTFDLKPD